MKYTFLIADDESVEREGLSFLLTRRGYPIRILEAVNGEQALEIVSREPVDVLITDIRMPFMDGLELARRIRERDARMKILVCTAYGEFEYAQKAISSGVTAYLLKPVQREEFYEKIDQVLAWLDEEEKRSQPAAPDMEKIWYGLSHGHAMDDKARRALAAKGLAPDGAQPVLMLVKFPGSEIENRVGEFEALLRPRVGGLWIMSNCRAMLLFEQTALLPDEALLAFGHEIQRSLKEGLGATPRVLLSQPRNGAAGLTEGWQRLEAQGELRLYAAGSVILPDARQANEDERVLEQLNRLVHEAKRALERGDSPEAVSRLEELTGALRLIGDVSAMYVRYIAMEAVTALIQSGRDPSAVKPSMDEILSAHSTEQMADLIDRHAHYLADEARRGGEDAIETLLAAVHQRYNEPLTLDALARSVYMTPSYVSFLFRQRTGTTLIKYITEYRLSRAEEMLRQGGKSVTEVAQRVGYDNISYFGSLFKTRFGVSPAQYARGSKGAGEGKP